MHTKIMTSTTPTMAAPPMVAVFTPSAGLELELELEPEPPESDSLLAMDFSGTGASVGARVGAPGNAGAGVPLG